MSANSMLELLLLKAKAEKLRSVETAAKAADDAMAKIVEQLKAKDIPVAIMERSTREYDAQITIYDGKDYQITMQVGDDGKGEVQMWDEANQVMKHGKNSKSVKDWVSDIGAFAKKVKAARAKSKAKSPQAKVIIKMDKNDPGKVVLKPKDIIQSHEAKWPDFNGSATKARNFLIKNFGGRAIKSWGTSNPYDTTQLMEMIVTPAQAKKIIAGAVAAREVKAETSNSRAATIRITHSDVIINVSTMNKVVQIYGNKKGRAHPSFSPYD